MKPDFVGWTGLGPIAMLIENVIGLHLNVPEARVEWHVRLTEEHGVKNMPIGQGRADFSCAAREGTDRPAEVVVSSDVPLAVTVRRGNACEVLAIAAGASVSATV